MDGVSRKFEMAYYRVKYPAELSKEMLGNYIFYLEKCARHIVYIMVLKNISLEEIAKFPYLNKLEEEDFQAIIDLSAKKGRTDVTAFLLNYKNERF